MATAPPAPTGVLTFGSVSLKPAQEYEVFRPFANFVAANLHEVEIGRGRVVVVGSLSQMVEELQEGRVDLFIDSPFPAAFVWKHGNTQPLLRRWKRGSDSYRSVVFARSDSGIDSLDDLSGKILAFGEPFSTTGFLMPKAALASAGLRLVNYEDPAASIPDDRVGYVFSNDAENTMFWVLKRKVAAGAVNADYFEALAGGRIGELRILHTTDEPYPETWCACETTSIRRWCRQSKRCCSRCTSARKAARRSKPSRRPRSSIDFHGARSRIWRTS